ncbi:PhnA-like protein [Sinorhizobium sp. 7-81]|uniref:PhnA-like protein n=1 Tax=Sinorhizobium sp. 8-89 TaxID=3049089 RepID=UPI0024C3546F|nr:PhnA-like protein [Sinorhizobium sp. 8-89]MDK1489356.1 PhnA-like protein [Sinorhizobium sp. 8-89]
MSEPVAVHHARETDYVSDLSASAAVNQISWGAVFAGVALALAVQFLLNLLGVGIGAAVIDPATADNPNASTFSIAGGLWFVISGIVAAFVGGYVASRVSGRPSRATGSYHGLTSWAVTTLVILYLLTTSVGVVVGGAFSGLSSIVGGVGRTAAIATTAAAPAVATSVDPMADIERQIRSATGGNDPAALRDAAVAAVRAVVTGDEATAEEARNRAADAIARAQNIPVDQARTQVQEYEESYRASVERAKQQATEAADTAATVVSSGALLGFLSLVVGALAAWFGGAAGTTRTVATTDSTRRVG